MKIFFCRNGWASPLPCLYKGQQWVWTWAWLYIHYVTCLSWNLTVSRSPGASQDLDGSFLTASTGRRYLTAPTPDTPFFPCILCPTNQPGFLREAQLSVRPRVNINYCHKGFKNNYLMMQIAHFFFSQPVAEESCDGKERAQYRHTSEGSSQTASSRGQELQLKGR